MHIANSMLFTTFFVCNFTLTLVNYNISHYLYLEHVVLNEPKHNRRQCVDHSHMTCRFAKAIELSGSDRVMIMIIWKINQWKLNLRYGVFVQWLETNQTLFYSQNTLGLDRSLRSSQRWKIITHQPGSCYLFYVIINVLLICGVYTYKLFLIALRYQHYIWPGSSSHDCEQAKLDFMTCHGYFYNSNHVKHE